VYISKLEVAAGDTITNGEQLAEIDGEPLFALTGPVPAWRDLTPGESGPDVTELQKALASLGYYDGGDTAGYFGSATEDAVSAYYEHLGYSAPASGAVAARDRGRGERGRRRATRPAVPRARPPRLARADR
jgi:peptidoglycan hydrolase-like protein with peptidoglycan-binding domain